VRGVGVESGESAMMVDPMERRGRGLGIRDWELVGGCGGSDDKEPRGRAVGVRVQSWTTGLRGPDFVPVNSRGELRKGLQLNGLYGISGQIGECVSLPHLDRWEGNLFAEMVKGEHARITGINHTECAGS